MKPVHSGFALSPCKNLAREALLQSSTQLIQYVGKLDALVNWISVIIPTIPKNIRTLEGIVEVSKDMLAEEIERVASIRPSFLKLYGRNIIEAPHRT